MAITKITRDALNTGIDDNSDATAITIDSSERVGVGAAPNATFGSLLYTQGTPAANKPIISGYSQGNSNNAGLALFNDAGNRGIWTNGSSMRFTRTYEGNSTADMTIDASGRVTMPSQPSFCARLLATTTTAGAKWTTHGTPQHNVGNHWSTSTHRFTCPISGRYMLLCSGYTNYTPSYGYMNLYINGTNQGAYARHFQHSTATSTLVCR